MKLGPCAHWFRLRHPRRQKTLGYFDEKSCTYAKGDTLYYVPQTFRFSGDESEPNL